MPLTDTDVIYLDEDADIEQLRTIVGKQGSRLNPIQDEDGKWIISMEELREAETGEFKGEEKVYKDLLKELEKGTVKKYKKVKEKTHPSGETFHK